MENSSKREYALTLLRDLGLEEEAPSADFEHEVNTRFGKDGKRFLNANSRMGVCDKLYGLKNSSLELSLYVTSQKFQHVNAAFLEWMISTFDREPKMVLDIGCDSGVLTCAMAKHWPGARFIGLEPNAKAAEVARQLVSRHRLENVEIRCMRLEDVEELAPDLKDSCDLIVGLCVFHEIFESLRDAEQESAPIFGIDDAEITEIPDDSALRSVVYALAPDGLLLAGSRWSAPEHTLGWMRLAEKAGLQADLANSFMLEGNSPDGTETFPVTIHRATECPVRATPDDVLALHAAPRVRESFGSMEMEGPVAEVMYRSLGAMELLMSFEAVYYDGSGTERRAIFTAGGVVGMYQTTSRGYRRIQVGPLADLPGMIRTVVEAAEFATCVADVESIPPEEIDQRWSLYGVLEILRAGVLTEST